ncbi:hypothetical protein [Bacillus pseudomycoides]|nr:hypothetical protein [Bacillus pseudomycoides]
MELFGGFIAGFIVCLVIMIQFIKAKEVKEMTEDEKTQLKEMEWVAKHRAHTNS